MGMAATAMGLWAIDRGSGYASGVGWAGVCDVVMLPG